MMMRGQYQFLLAFSLLLVGCSRFFQVKLRFFKDLDILLIVQRCRTRLHSCHRLVRSSGAPWELQREVVLCGEFEKEKEEKVRINLKFLCCGQW